MSKILDLLILVVFKILKLLKVGQKNTLKNGWRCTSSGVLVGSVILTRVPISLF